MLLTLFLPCAAMRVAPPVMQLRNGVPYAPSSVQQQTAAASTAGAAGFSGGVVPTSTAQGSLQQKVETLRSQLNLASGQSLRQTIAEAVRTIGLDADVKSLNLLQTVAAAALSRSRSRSLSLSLRLRQRLRLRLSLSLTLNLALALTSSPVISSACAALG